jgi:hypothetical protein
MARVETVEVNRNGTKVIINKSDFDPQKDTIWGEQKKFEPKERLMSNEQYLADKYEKLYGKKPHHKLKIESIKAAIAEKEAE